MELSSLKLKPQLIEITISDEDIIEMYGEAVTFYMKDHLDIQTYFDFYKHQRESNLDELIVIVKKILMNKSGKLILSKDETLPVVLMSRVIGAIGDQMANSSEFKKPEPEVKPESLPAKTEV